MIKIYVHYNSLKAYQNGEWVNARLAFIGQDDIELYVKLKDVIIAYQQNGFTIRKKKWHERLFHKKSVK